jgi:hypothetical protein
MERTVTGAETDSWKLLALFGLVDAKVKVGVLRAVPLAHRPYSCCGAYPNRISLWTLAEYLFLIRYIWLSFLRTE